MKPREWRGGEKLPEAEASRHSGHREGGLRGAVGTMCGNGRGRSPQHPRPPALSSAGYTFLEILFTLMLLCILAGIGIPGV